MTREHFVMQDIATSTRITHQVPALNKFSLIKFEARFLARNDTYIWPTKTVLSVGRVPYLNPM